MTQRIVMETKRGPGFLVRVLWFVLIGWWLTGVMSLLAWLAMISIILLPLGIYLINRIPTFIALRPRTRQIEASVDSEGTMHIVESGRSLQPWYIRFLWFLVVGWWASFIVMAVAWILVVLIVTLPLGLLLYNRVPFVASLYRY